MVIQSDNLPFQLEFKSCSVKESYLFNNIVFYDDINDIYAKDSGASFKINEGTDLLVNLIAIGDADVSLTMDGLELIDVPDLQHGDETFLKATNGFVKLFDHDDFPLPPGNYIIVVRVGSTRYITDFEVIASRFGNDTWKFMAREIVEKVKLLAFDIVKKKTAISNIPLKSFEIGALVLKMNVVDSYYNKVIASLDGLCGGAHHKISKQYVLESALSRGKRDSKSQRLNTRLKYPSYAYVPVKYTDYNLPENVYIKILVIRLDKLLNSFIEELGMLEEYFCSKLDADEYGRKNNTNNYQKNIGALAIVSDYYDKASRIISSIRKLEETDWFKNINANVITKVPSQSMLDPRYGILSKLSKDLKEKTINYSLESNLSVVWKRSDTLYEMWCFIKLIEGFQSLDFQLDTYFGFIDDSGTIRIASIKKGDVFCLHKGSLMIKMYYDTSMPNDDSVTDRYSTPLYVTKGNNTPDCRIDFYYSFASQAYYVGSLIVDFKYRTKKAFWDSNDTFRSSRAQLNAYKNLPKTKFFSIKNENLSKNSISPIKEVWAIYPDRYFPTAETDAFSECVKLYSLVPGYEDKMSEYISKFINDFIVPETQDIEFYMTYKNSNKL